jgi:hypothetical protein
LTPGRSLRGWSVPLAPSPRNPIVLTPRRGSYKIAQGRASRRSRDAPPWVAEPRRAALGNKALQVPSPRRGMTRPRHHFDDASGLLSAKDAPVETHELCLLSMIA